jgi:hypothetical protein
MVWIDLIIFNIILLIDIRTNLWNFFVSISGLFNSTSSNWSPEDISLDLSLSVASIFSPPNFLLIFLRKGIFTFAKPLVPFMESNYLDGEAAANDDWSKDIEWPHDKIISALLSIHHLFNFHFHNLLYLNLYLHFDFDLYFDLHFNLNFNLNFGHNTGICDTSTLFRVKLSDVMVIYSFQV